MDEIKIRECVTIEELDRCVSLQRDVFGLPDLEISPRRHLVVSRQAGGWTLGAFTTEGRLAGFVHHLAAVRGVEILGYSHMMAVDRKYQNQGIGARLKWAQRERALAEGRQFHQVDLGPDAVSKCTFQSEPPGRSRPQLCGKLLRHRLWHRPGSTVGGDAWSGYRSTVCRMGTHFPARQPA